MYFMSIGFYIVFMTLSSCSVIDNQPQWRPLFDGLSLNGWTSSNGSPIGEQWQVVNGELVLTSAGGGDIITEDIFGDFELSLEWKITNQGNSGIFYRVAPDHQPVWMTGIEYQVLDNDSYPMQGADKENHTAGSVYGLYAPIFNASKPAMEFNHARIIVKNNQVEHWLNGKKIVAYKLGSDDWNHRVRSSKFLNFTGFGLAQRGHIALQDHGKKVWYRNIKIKEL